MVKRYTIEFVATRLELAVVDVLAAVARGEFVSEVQIGHEFLPVPMEIVEKSIEGGFLFIEELKQYPTPLSPDRIDALKNYPDWARSSVSHLPLRELRIREDEIANHLVRFDEFINGARSSTAGAAKCKTVKKRKPRSEQQRVTRSRDETVRNFALDCLKSDNGEDYLDKHGKPSKAKLVAHILNKKSTAPELKNLPITKNVVRRVLVRISKTKL